MNTNGAKVLGGAMLLLAVMAATWDSILAATPPFVPPETASQTVKGEVVMMAGELQKVQEGTETKEVLIVDELYVVQNGNDEGTFLLVDEHTKLNGTVQVGDQVEARVSADGHALSIHPIQETRY